MNSISHSPAGVYVHIPFCVKKCLYCDFYSITDFQKINSFIRCAQNEIGFVDTPIHRVDTIYFGGGTPTALDAKSICRLMDAIRQRYSVAEDVEATIEANPGTITIDKFIEYRKAGINRINIGIQSFQDYFLGFLGRIHNARQALASFDMARKCGFDNIGVDLIYGLPSQSAKMWEDDLETAVKLAPEHISCYQLTYESGTPLTMDLEKGRIHAMPEEESAALFEVTGRFLEEAGFIHYEISNFARSPATRSRHNLKYWSFVPYIGIGPSAHSFIFNRRSWNVRSVDAYIDRIESGRTPCDGSETLDLNQQMIETIYLGLRCFSGICLEEFKKQFSVDFEKQFAHSISVFESQGYMVFSYGYCRLTLKGMRFLDSIVKRFVYDI